MYFTLLHICEHINISNPEKYYAQETIDNLTVKNESYMVFTLEICFFLLLQIDIPSSSSPTLKSDPSVGSAKLIQTIGSTNLIQPKADH